MTRTILALLVVSILAPLGGAAEEDAASRYWPSWRGPLSSGVAPHGNPPTEWSETENIRWKVKLPGPGHATPVVWGERIYLLAVVRTEADAERTSSVPASSSVIPASFRQEQQQPPRRPEGRRGPPRAPKPTHTHQFVVLALERATGKTVWQTIVREEVPHEAGHITASQASASLVTDGEHVWASFGSRGLYCLDKNGKVIWEKDFGDMRTRNEFGEGASPALHGDTLIVNWDHGSAPASWPSLSTL